MNWLLLTLLGAVAEGQVIIRRGRSLVGVDASSLAPAGNFVPATTDAYDLGLLGTRWRRAYLSGYLVAPTVGPNATQQHTLPAVTSSTLAVLGAAQTWTAAQTVAIDNATNNNVTTFVTHTHTTSGTPTAGLGVRYLARGEATAGTQDLGALDFLFSDVGSSTEATGARIMLRTGGAAIAEAFAVSMGGAQFAGGVGKYGTPAPSQPPTIAAITPSTGGAIDGADTVDKAALLTLIQNLQSKVNQLSSALRGDGTVAAS